MLSSEDFSKVKHGIIWIMATDVRDDMRVAVPLINCVVSYDLAAYQRMLRTEIAETHSRMKMTTDMSKLHSMMCECIEKIGLEGVFTGMSGQDANGMQISAADGDSFNKSLEGKLRTLKQAMCAEAILIFADHRMPVRGVCFTNTYPDVVTYTKREEAPPERAERKSK